MTDDPWRSTVVYDPDLAPPPDSRGEKRVLWIVGVLTVVLIGGLGLALYVRSHSSSKEINSTETFLRDVRDRQFTTAYAQVCPGEQTAGARTKFTASLQNAAAHGRGVTGFDIVSGNTSQHIKGGSGTARAAQGTVTFADGRNIVLTLLLTKSGGRLCVLSGYNALY